MVLAAIPAGTNGFCSRGPNQGQETQGLQGICTNKATASGGQSEKDMNTCRPIKGRRKVCSHGTVGCTVDHLADELREYRECFALAEQYEAAVKAIAAWKEKHLPRKTEVEVDHHRYQGKGVVVSAEGCPVDHVAVRLPNDNVWFYPITYVKPITLEKR